MNTLRHDYLTYRKRKANGGTKEGTQLMFGDRARQIEKQCDEIGAEIAKIIFNKVSELEIIIQVIC